MLIKDERGYRCAFCGKRLAIPPNGEPRFSARGSNERILSINGVEVHRCTPVGRNDLAAR